MEVHYLKTKKKLNIFQALKEAEEGSYSNHLNEKTAEFIL